ncbi:chemotaxis protein CheY [Thermoplasmatales archaeon SG8-52-1]|nr:MAG: chemotaxis protein CheY [Thermoplasmatales archaeon SG8-52-1]
MKKKIMVVDDEPDQIFTAKMILEDLGSEYEVIGVSSGNKCIEMLKKNKIPDIIFLDIMMPGMNGWDVAAEIKKNPKWKKIPLVFLTAKTDSLSATFGKIVSEDYILKPFEISDLKKSIDKFLD